MQVAQKKTELRRAVHAANARGLRISAQFASEMLCSVPEPEGTFPASSGAGSSSQEPMTDLYLMAKAYFDRGEYLRAAHALQNLPQVRRDAATGIIVPGDPLAYFLRCYSLFLAGERHREEHLAELGGSQHHWPPGLPAANQGERAARQSNAPDPAGNIPADSSHPAASVVSGAAVAASSNENISLLHDELTTLYKADLLDGFLLYLYAIVLRALGRPNEEAKRVLCEAVRAYPLNWSAWFDLATLCPDVGSLEMLTVRRKRKGNGSGGVSNENLDYSLPDHWVTLCFYAYTWGELQRYDNALDCFVALEEELPGSQECGWTKTKKAKVYHDSRVGYDEAEILYEDLRNQEPYRLEGMDLYSNILFMSERRAQLSHLAHSAIKVDKYRPETCCIVGNYYSLKKQHERAVIYFRRALKLDPHYLAAWTLIGHEYVEMQNTEAAIQAYRRAVDIDSKDYRAWYGLGQTYEILTMHSYALYYYRKAVMIRPADARMWVALGQCYQKLKKTNEAIASYERAYGHGDHEGIAALALGKLFKGKQNFELAAEYFKKHVKKQDEEQRVGEGYATSLLFLARYYERNEDYPAAEACCQKLSSIGSHQETEEAKSIMRQIRSKQHMKTVRMAQFE